MRNNIRKQRQHNTTLSETLYIVERLDTEHGVALLEEISKNTAKGSEETIIYSSVYCPKALLSQKTSELLSKKELTDEEYETLAYIAKNTSTPLNALKQLMQYKNFILNTLIAANPVVTEDMLDVLSKDKAWQVRQQVAFNPITSRETIETLTKDPDTNVKNTALTHPKIGENILLEVFNKNPDLQTLRAVASNINLPSDIAEKLSDHHSTSVRAAIANNTSTSKDLLYKLSKSEHSSILAAIAKNPNIPKDLSISLSNPVHDLNIRANLSENPNIALQAAILLLVDPIPAVRRKTALTQKHLSPASLAQAGLEEEDPRVLAAITTHPKMPTTTATRIVAKTLTNKELSYSKSLIRAIVYSNSSVQPGIAYLIAGIDDPKTLAILATRSDCPLAIFTASAKHENVILRRAAAANSECPPDLLHRLSIDEDILTATLAKTHPSYIAIENK